MARKYDLISEMYDRESKTVVSTPENWEAFLRSACYNFRLRFDEQLLVYAQRPEATAVLEIERWNESFGRWVNKGAHGIAVFADENRSTQRLTHYFDISDTHGSRYARPVPIWEMQDEYTEDVIDSLENTFGELEDRKDLGSAILSAAKNAVEDNITDYLGDLLVSTSGSFLDGVSEEEIEQTYKQTVTNSVAYMMMSRLGVDTEDFFEADDFRGAVNFTTPDTLNTIGFATSDIAEMGLAEVSRTILSLSRNRIIAENRNPDYNVVENQTERSFDNERTDLHDAGRLQSSEPQLAGAAGGNAGTIRTDAPQVPQGEPQGSVLQSADEVQNDRTSVGSGTESDRYGRNADEANVSQRGLDREPESGGYDDLGSEDEQSEKPSSGNRDDGSNFRLEYYDRDHEDKSLPFFGHDDTIREILGATPHLKASKSEIRVFYETHPDTAERTEYIKSIFNNDYTEVLIGEDHDHRVGYKTMQNVLHLWDGSYQDRTAQSFYDWRVIAQHFEAMRLLGELQDTMKPLPSIDGQMSLIDARAEEKTSAFSFSHEIVDAVLTRGSGVSEGKMRIYEQFQKSLSHKENADFLKNEYGWGGSYPVITGAGIDENHDGKGITITKGIGSDKPHISLSWTQVEKRIGELISLDRYLNPKEKEQYPQWLEAQEQRRAEMAERNANREILNTAPPEKETVQTPTTYEYHLGDTVYIGASEYEILSLDSDRILLYDTDYPLFNKEMDRDEFERKVKENPMNDHLKVEVPQNAVSSWQEYSEIKERNPNTVIFYQMGDFYEVMGADAVYVSVELELAITQRTEENGERIDIVGIPSNRLDENTDKLRSLGYDVFVAPLEVGKRNEYIFSSTRKTEQTVETNIGTMPIEDYREIQATQNGFDSYEDMYNQGIRLGVGMDKEPEPLKPSFENKPKRKAQSFDIHQNIPMADRHTFDLANNEVETVGKKERFRRNIMAIQLLKKCQDENRFATPDEQIILSKYVGWGGIPEAFDENNSSWATEYLELSAVLAPDEYARAKESTLTAFYTPPEVISAIYKALEQMGFREGNVLEPSCGIGNFIGMLPDAMKDSKFYGVELDPISAGIAQQLYQKSSIAAQGYEEANLPDSFFDAVVGNVPFGDFKIADKRYEKNNFLIHDYFFAKSLDKLRPGGVMALVTSKGTMDKENSNVRKYIAQRADLLGAIRLPNNTFKGNAGTEVVSDILILQKRDRIVDIEPEWVQLDTDENGIRMNSYFVQHPEMILGEMKMVSGRFGPEATCEPYENADLASQLDDAIANIHGEVSDYEVDGELAEEDNSIPADPTVRNFSYTILNDAIYFRENSRMTPVEVSVTAENRIKGLIAIRDCVRNLIELQTEDFPDEDITREQTRLNSLYDSFTKKYGLINSRANISAFSQDSSYSLLSALEVIGDDGELERKADMFSKRTIKPHKAVTHCDTVNEALAVSMGEKAQVDMEYMCELTGKTEEEIFADLKGVIFLNPLYEYGISNFQKYLMADEYLSGNVREKLTIARSSAKLYPEDYTVNVEALERVQPKDLSASEIAVRLGAVWVPPEIVQQFMFEFLDTPRYSQWNIKVHFSQFTSEWNIEGKAYDRSNVKAYSTYGTGRINAYKIIEETVITSIKWTT